MTLKQEMHTVREWWRSTKKFVRLKASGGDPVAREARRAQPRSYEEGW